MSKNGNSANTAILAIFVLVLLAMIGFFILRNDKPEEKVEFSVDLPEVVDIDKGKQNGNK